MQETTSTADELSWVDAENGYRLALTWPKGKLVCRNKAGKQLASVPSAVKKGAAARQLTELRDFVLQHQQECQQSVESWMLGSLPVPRSLLEAAWPDPCWRRFLEHTVVAPGALSQAPSVQRAGFLRGVDAARGVGIVNLDGETEWIATELVVIPHPILLPDLQDFRELLGELALEQGLLQLFRETFERPGELGSTHEVNDYAGGKFEAVTHAVGRSRSLGYRVRGGYATCAVFEDGRHIEARYWIGSGDSYEEVWTGELGWVDEDEHAIKLCDIGPVAYSEGVRMAAAIYAGRQKEEQQ